MKISDKADINHTLWREELERLIKSGPEEAKMSDSRIAKGPTGIPNEAGSSACTVQVIHDARVEFQSNDYKGVQPFTIIYELR